MDGSPVQLPSWPYDLDLNGGGRREHRQFTYPHEKTDFVSSGSCHDARTLFFFFLFAAVGAVGSSTITVTLFDMTAGLNNL